MYALYDETGLYIEYQKYDVCERPSGTGITHFNSRFDGIKVDDVVLAFHSALNYKLCQKTDSNN